MRDYFANRVRTRRIHLHAPTGSGNHDGGNDEWPGCAADRRFEPVRLLGFTVRFPHKLDKAKSMTEWIREGDAF